MNFASLPNYFILVMVGSALLAILIDALMGDPHKKWHPVNVIGNTLTIFKRKLQTGHARRDKVNGVVLILLVALIAGGVYFTFQAATWGFLGIWETSLPEGSLMQVLYVVLFCLVMGFGLKWTFAIRNLGDETLPIMKALQAGNLVDARSRLSMIVRRDTKLLDESHVISAVVEVIAESATDGITSVFWYYFIGCFFGGLFFRIAEILTPSWGGNYLWLLLGIPFAYLFRIINTADSIVGYKDPENLNIGWFTAKMDNLSHVVTTPLTVGCTLIVGKALKLDVKNGWRILREDRKKTTSTNAGWTISAMAGLLNVQLEKIGYYALGRPERALSPSDIQSSFRVVRIASILCVIILACIFLPGIWFLVYWI
jgi:adenosylcobinamide-phosphate synthase